MFCYLPTLERLVRIEGKEKRAMICKLRMFVKAHTFERYFTMKARFMSNWCFEYSSYVSLKGQLNPKDNDGWYDGSTKIYTLCL